MLLYQIFIIFSILTACLAKRSSRKKALSTSVSTSQSSNSESSTSNESSSTRIKVIAEFPNKLQPVKRKLIYYVRAYMKQLYTEGPKEERNLSRLLANSGKDYPSRTKSLTMKWQPVECKILPLRLRKLRTLQDGKRNLVLQMYDRESKKKYVWKRYANPDEYSAEMAFYTVAASHPNIVKAVCYQKCKETEQAGLLIEYVEGQTSLQYTKTASHKQIRRLAAQTYDVIKFMHWLGFLHADMKPENVMVNEKGDAVAIDFGFAIKLPYSKYYRGTPTTISPELVKVVKGDILENIDYWALGSTIAQWYGMGDARLKRKKGEKKWVPVRISHHHGYMFGKLPTHFSKKLRQILYFLMNPNPQLRKFNTLTQQQWLESLPYWKGVDFDKMRSRW